MNLKTPYLVPRIHQAYGCKSNLWCPPVANIKISKVVIPKTCYPINGNDAL